MLLLTIKCFTSSTSTSFIFRLSHTVHKNHGYGNGHSTTYSNIYDHAAIKSVFKYTNI